jgi:hypothetical protein
VGLRWVTGSCLLGGMAEAPPGLGGSLPVVLSEGGVMVWLAQVVPVMVPGGGCSFLILLSCGSSPRRSRMWRRSSGGLGCRSRGRRYGVYDFSATIPAGNGPYTIDLVGVNSTVVSAKQLSHLQLTCG